MAIAKELPEVNPFFMQECPACGRMNRVVVKGIYKNGDNHELYPDIGYSFCNCKAIFYTNYENVKVKDRNGLEYFEKPWEEMKNLFDSMPSGNILAFNTPDQFFCEWGNNPYTFEHWNPRLNHVLFDMTQLCEDLKEVGFEVLEVQREFDVHAKSPKTMRITIRKP